MSTPYFYIIKHIPSGKFYAGSKYGKDADPSKLMIERGYQTSSKDVKKIIKTDGLASFSIDRIKIFKTSDEAVNYESRFLKRINAAAHSNFINKNNNDKKFLNKGGYKLTEKTKQKMSKPKSKETIEKQNHEKLNRDKSVYDKMVQSRRENNDYWNSPETCEKIKQANDIRWSDEENRKNQSEIMIEYYKNNPVSEETKSKISEKTKGEENPMFGKKQSESAKEKMKAAWARRKAAKENNLNEQ